MRIRKKLTLSIILLLSIVLALPLAGQGGESGEWTVYTINDGAGDDGQRDQWTTDIDVTADGTVWAVTRSDGMAHFDGDAWRTLQDISQVLIPDQFFYCCFTADSNGTIWLGMYQVIGRYDGDGWVFYKHRRSNSPNDFGENLFAEYDATVVYLDDPDLPTFEDITSLATDSQGVLWVGTHEGLARFDGQAWTGYRMEDGLICNQILAVAVAPDDTVWVGTFAGLSHFDGTNWTRYPKTGLPHTGHLYRLSVAGDGVVWGVNHQEIFWFDGENWGAPDEVDEMDIGDVWSITSAPDGSVWVGSVNGLSHYDGAGWTFYPLERNRLPASADPYWFGVITLAVAPDGAVWGGTQSGIVRFRPVEQVAAR